MKTPRKHAELIRQWADDDSLVIELKTNKGEWIELRDPHFENECEYRIKPTKPSIDWSHLGDDFVQIATDKNGEAYAFTDGKLDQSNDFWKCHEKMKYASLKGFASFNRGTCDWKDSLVQRPEGE